MPEAFEPSPASQVDLRRAQASTQARRAAALADLLFTQRCKVFALLDAARDSHVVRLLEQGDCEYACLYKGQAAETYKAYAPYFVKLARDAHVTTALLTQGWGQSTGYFFGSLANEGSIHTHLRKFLFATLPSGKRAYFRFYDPRVIRVFLPNCKQPQLDDFFRDELDWILVEDPDPAFALVYGRPTAAELNLLGLDTRLTFSRIDLDREPMNSHTDQEPTHHANRPATV